MPYSNNQPGSMTLNHELDLFYDTLVVCGFQRCKGLMKNPSRVTLSHYINDRLSKVVGLIPTTVVNNPIRDIEKTCENTSICSFFENLEFKKISFILNWTTCLLLSSQQRFLVSQSMISILPKTHVLGDPKNCMS